MAPIEETESPPPPPVPPARYRITAPGPVSGSVMGVAFANGHGLLSDPARQARALLWFEAEPGYSVEMIDPPAPEQAVEAPVKEPETAPEAAEETPASEDSPEPAARRRK
ncbi:hypothetical protein [Streptomyces sp. NPDC051577]|uniref:hypothetical protein n=1 Tax=Streptomyces sp. NPDC051577 TaxID=3155166 RepID=UPI003416A50A